MKPMSHTKKTIFRQSYLFSLPVLIAALSIVFLTSCRIEVNGANGGSIRKMETRAVPVPVFESIELSSSYDVRYIPSDSFSVTVRGPQRQLDYVDIKVKGGRLCISEKKHDDGMTVIGYGDDYDGVTVTVKAPEITSVNITGSGDFSCDRTMRAESLVLSINGSGDIDIKNIVSSVVKASVNGSGDIEASLSGVSTTDVSVIGSGDADLKLNRCGSVSANVAGSGDITLSGSVKHLTQNVSGSGDINVDELSTGTSAGTK